MRAVLRHSCAQAVTHIRGLSAEMRNRGRNECERARLFTLYAKQCFKLRSIEGFFDEKFLNRQTDAIRMEFVENMSSTYVISNSSANKNDEAESLTKMQSRARKNGIARLIITMCTRGFPLLSSTTASRCDFSIQFPLLARHPRELPLRK